MKMNPASAFVQAFERFGTPLAYDGLHAVTVSGFKEHLMWFRTVLKNGRVVPEPRVPTGDIYCDFVDNASFNAMATCFEGCELIGVFAGTVVFIHRYFVAFLSDPTVLPTIGNVLAEQVDEEALVGLREASPMVTGRNSPRDPVRLQIAQHLGWCAIQLLFAHELAHICRGHLLLLKEEFGLRDYLEVPLTPLSATECRLRRALEIDADMAAVGANYRTWQAMISRGAFPAMQPISTTASWSMSTAMLFFILSAVQPKEVDWNHCSHPDPFTRFINAFHVAQGGEETFPPGISWDELMAGLDEVSTWWKKARLPSVPSPGDYVDLLRSVRRDLYDLSKRQQKHAEQRARQIRSQL